MDILNRQGIRIEDLFDENISDDLFVYSKDEIVDFTKIINKYNLPSLIQSVVKGIKKQPKVSSVKKIMDLLNLLSPNDIQHIEKYLREYLESSPTMLWNMLHPADRKLYKNKDSFHDWLSTLSDDMLDQYIYRASDGRKLHSAYIYKPSMEGTTVEILDGYIAISSANLSALDKFKDRMLATNNCEYEHRIKQHGKVTIHSYVFNMNKQDSSN